MKKIFFLLILVKCSILPSYAQDATNFWKEFQTLFNSKEFNRIYDQMLSQEFQKNFSKSEWLSFLSDDIYNQGGNLDSFRIPSETKVLLYFEKFILSGDFYLNAQNQLEGVMLQPYQNKELATVVPHSNNPMQSIMDKIIEEKVIDFYHKTNSYSEISIAFIDNGIINFYHYAPQEKQLPTHQSIYEIGSISKTFTALLIRQAILENQLSLDTDIRIFFKDPIPNLEKDGECIRIKHLLIHTSGLPRLPSNYNKHPLFDINDPYVYYSDTLLKSELLSVQLLSKPGEQIDYSNFGFTLLGFILKQIYQDDLETIYNNFLQKEVGLPAITLSVVPAMLKGYDADANELKHWTFNEASGVAAAGGIKTTIEVMAQYILAQIQEKHPAIKASHEVLFQNTNTSLASSWIFQNINGIDVYWHNGATGGFTSFAAFNPTKGKGIVVLNNTSHSVDALSVGIIKELFK